METKLDFSLIKCIAYDFDGVMTDNRVLVMENGLEAVFCNRSDGLAISRFKNIGIHQVVISTEKNLVVESRVKKLQIDVIHGVLDKGMILKDYCLRKQIDLSSVLFIGNDINDVPAFMVAGVTGAPADAAKEIRDMADWVSTKKGGYGVVRELYDVYLGEKKGK